MPAVYGGSAPARLHARHAAGTDIGTRWRGRHLNEDEITALQSTATIGEWCQVAYRILDDPSVSIISLAHSVGMKPVTAHHRLAKRRPKGWESKGSGNRVQPEDP